MSVSDPFRVRVWIDSAMFRIGKWLCGVGPTEACTGSSYEADEAHEIVSTHRRALLGLLLDHDRQIEQRKRWLLKLLLRSLHPRPFSGGPVLRLSPAAHPFTAAVTFPDHSLLLPSARLRLVATARLFYSLCRTIQHLHQPSFQPIQIRLPHSLCRQPFHTPYLRLTLHSLPFQPVHLLRTERTNTHIQQLLDAVHQAVLSQLVE